MEKTIKELKFDKAWLCTLLMEIRDELKAHGTLDADRKDEIGFTVLEAIEATLDSVGAVEAVAKELDEQKLGYLKWYRERGHFLFPDMKPPEGWQP